MPVAQFPVGRSRSRVRRPDRKRQQAAPPVPEEGRDVDRVPHEIVQVLPIAYPRHPPHRAMIVVVVFARRRVGGGGGGDEFHDPVRGPAPQQRSHPDAGRPDETHATPTGRLDHASSETYEFVREGFVKAGYAGGEVRPSVVVAVVVVVVVVEVEVEVVVVEVEVPAPWTAGRRRRRRRSGGFERGQRPVVVAAYAPLVVVPGRFPRRGGRRRRSSPTTGEDGGGRRRARRGHRRRAIHRRRGRESRGSSYERGGYRDHR